MAFYQYFLFYLGFTGTQTNFTEKRFSVELNDKLTCLKQLMSTKLSMKVTYDQDKLDDKEFDGIFTQYTKLVMDCDSMVEDYIRVSFHLY